MAFVGNVPVTVMSIQFERKSLTVIESTLSTFCFSITMSVLYLYGLEGLLRFGLKFRLRVWLGFIGSCCGTEFKSSKPGIFQVS